MATRKNLSLGPIGPYFAALCRHAGIKSLVALGLGLVVGLTEGIGLLILRPFLGLIGGGDGGSSSLPVISHVSRMFLTSGIPITIPVVLFTYLLLISVHAFSRRIQEVLIANITHSFVLALSDKFYRAMVYTDWLIFVRSKTSDITHVLTAEVKHVGNATKQLFHLIGAITLAIVHMSIAISISMSISLVALGISGILILSLRRFHDLTYQSGDRLSRNAESYHFLISEHLSGMKIAKSHGMESTHIKHFREIAGEMSQERIRYDKIRAESQTYLQIGSALSLCLLLYVAVVIIQIPPAKLILMVLIFSRLLPRISQINQVLQQIVHAIPRFEAYQRILDSFEERMDNWHSAVKSDMGLKRAIHVDQVSFSYSNELSTKALNGIDIVIPANAVTAIVGPSGAGKTTLADLLLGLLTPNEGTIRIDGEPLCGSRLSDWRRRVSYVPQDAFLYNDTIRNNLLWSAPSADQHAIVQALELAAAGFFSELPKGLDTVVGERGMRLSGGERQRIVLARALLRQPSLLLLDEATSSLDAENQSHFQRAIKLLQGKLTIVVITHRLNVIEGADSIVMLENGRVQNLDYQQLLHRERTSH